MKCEWVRENITLHVYGELLDDARHELEQHVARCADCAAELKAEQEFHAMLSQVRAPEPSPNLLAASRMRLQEALETAKQGSFWSRLAIDPANWLRQVRFSPALASAILILGFAGGIGTTIKFYGPQVARKDQPTIVNTGSAIPPDASIAAIDSVTPVPGTDQVAIKYNTVTTQQYQGPLNDQQVQQLLLYASRSNYNSGVRIDSVDLLAKRSSDLQVREALMYALQNDTNPGVRLKSLTALGTYVKTDTNVRDAVLQRAVDIMKGIRVLLSWQ